MSDSQKYYAVFLSHNSQDKEFVEALANKLVDEGLFPWFDKWELIAGNRWQGGLSDGVLISETCAIFIGPHNIGDWQSEEIGLAQTRAAAESLFRIIPVLLPGLPDPFDANALPPFLRQRVWVDFRKGIDDRDAFHSLLCGLKGINPRLKLDSDIPKDNDPGASDDRPYRGLQVFTEDDSKIYFGRAGEIQRLVEKLKTTRFLAVLGASGSGKSSLVRAGLIPCVRELPACQSWQLLPLLSPGSTPLETLVLSLASLPGMQVGGLLELLRSSEGALHAAVGNFLDAPSQRNSNTQRVLLIVDQLEEAFTLCERERDRSQFLANLLYAGSVPAGRCIVVLTIRADFYQRFTAYPEFAEMLAAQQFLVSTMQRDGLVEAIQRPAENAGWKFEAGLVETIVNDVTGQPGALPLMEHALLELWQRRKTKGLTLEAYIDTGRVQGAIAKRADAIYQSFSPEEKTVMQRIMLRLTQPGDGTDDTKRPASLDDLVTAPEDEEIVERVIAQMADPDHRLLTSDDKLGTRTFEISHEALIKGWDRLQGWLDEDREGRRLHHRLTEDAKEWKIQTDSGTSDEGLPYRGVRLAQLTEWRKRNESELNELERAFLNKGLELKQRREDEQRELHKKELEQTQRLAQAAQEQAFSARQARIARTFSAVLVVLLIVIMALAFYAYREYKAARSAEIAAEAIRVSASDQFLGILLAREALRISPTSQAETALRDTLIRSSLLKEVLAGHTAPVNTAAFSIDGTHLVTASDDGTVALWDLATGERQSTTVDSSSVTSASFSPDDQRLLLTTTYDQTAQIKTAQIWTLPSWDRWDVPKADGAIESAVILPGTNQLLVVKNKDKEQRVLQWWDLARREKVRSEVPIATTRVISISVSGNGKLLATTHKDGTANVWDENGKLRWKVKGHDGAVNSATFSRDGTTLLTAGNDKTVRVCDLKSKSVKVCDPGSKSVKVLVGHTGMVNSAEFSPDGKWILTASEDGTARVWDEKTGNVIWKLVGHSSSLNSAAFSPNGKLVATCADNNSIRVWDLTNGDIALEIPAHSRTVTGVIFRADSKQFVTTSRDRYAKVWNTSTHQLVASLRVDGAALGAAFSPDNRLLVTASYGQTAQVWDLANNQNTNTLSHSGSVNSVAFSHNGTWLVTACDDHTALVWDTATWKNIWTIKDHAGPVNDAIFSSDDKLLVTVSSDKTVKIWNTVTWSRVKELTGHGGSVMSAAFSSNGRQLVTTSSDKTARVWDTSDWRLVTELGGHTDTVITAMFSPDDKQLLTASRDSTVRVWAVDSWRMLWEAPSNVSGAAFSPDGKVLVTAGREGSIRIYDWTALGNVDGLLALAKKLVPRELTPEERRLYLP